MDVIRQFSFTEALTQTISQLDEIITAWVKYTLNESLNASMYYICHIQPKWIPKAVIVLQLFLITIQLSELYFLKFF